MFKNKKIDKIHYLACLLFLFLILCLFLSSMTNPERFYSFPNSVSASKSENISSINLCVIKKSQLPSGMLLTPTRYYLVLSNDMTVYVSAEQYKGYEENKYYDFELVETTTISSRLQHKELGE